MNRAQLQAMIVGGIGGALPMLIKLINIDASTMFEVKELSVLPLLGVFIKFLLLIALGAFWVWINSETNKRKALQLGIMAPALITALLNGNIIQEQKVQLQVNKQQLDDKLSQEEKRNTNSTLNIIEEQSLQLGMNPIRNAFAEKKQSALKGIHNEPTVFQLIWYGLTGNLDNGWFVYVGSYKRLEDAKAHVNRLKQIGYDARITSPIVGTEHYGVVIGSYLSLEEAEALRKAAIKDGLPSDSYIWKSPGIWKAWEKHSS